AMPTSAQQSAYLDAVCSDDSRLRERVLALLRADEEAGPFLETPAAQQMEINRPGDGDGPEARPGDTEGLRAAGGIDTEVTSVGRPRKPGVLGRWGHYEIQEVVGRGGMGVVLRAFDARLCRPVALKVMSAELAASATARQRFTREARAAAAIAHPHVV